MRENNNGDCIPPVMSTSVKFLRETGKEIMTSFCDCSQTIYSEMGFEKIMRTLYVFTRQHQNCCLFLYAEVPWVLEVFLAQFMASVLSVLFCTVTRSDCALKIAKAFEML